AYPKGCKTLKVAGERIKIPAPGKSGRHLALPKKNGFIIERLTNIARAWEVFHSMSPIPPIRQRPDSGGFGGLSEFYERKMVPFFVDN
ncbi:hypothetical protein AVEN_244339-1, partial [Araneus ventricosus]